MVRFIAVYVPVVNVPNLIPKETNAERSNRQGIVNVESVTILIPETKENSIIQDYVTSYTVNI